MATRDEILSYAGEYLELESYRDYGPMGLQVVGSADVEKIACGVSASRELLERATETQLLTPGAMSTGSAPLRRT